MKQIYILLIALLMGLSANAEEWVFCGLNLTWHLTDNGVLTISGKGKMNDFLYSSHGGPWNHLKIRRIIIGDGVTTIGEFAFYECYALTSVTIPNSVATIRDCAFARCIYLTSITIPNSVTTIGAFAFRDCTNLQKVNIGNSVKTIGIAAFENCTSITQISSEAAVPPTCKYNVFSDVNKSKCKLIVPKNSLDAYKQAYQWKNFLLIEGSTTGITNTCL